MENDKNINPFTQNPNKNGGILLAFFIVAGLSGLLGYLIANKDKVIIDEKPLDSIVMNDKVEVADKLDKQNDIEKEEQKLIEWSFPKEIEKQGLFLPDKDLDFNPEEDMKYYRVGKVLEGEYQDGEIIIAIGWVGPVSADDYFRFIKKDDKYNLLTQYSNNIEGVLFSDEVEIDQKFDIPELNYPETLQGTQLRQKLVKVEEDGFTGVDFFNENNLVEVFKDKEWGSVYTNTKTQEFNPADNSSEESYKKGDLGVFGKNGVYLKSPDNITITYKLDLDFMSEKSTPEITWSDGTKNDKEYIETALGGCGSGNYISVAEGVDISDLEKIGVNSKEDNIYKLKDDNHSILKTYYEKDYQVASGKKSSYQNFLSKRPIIFWVDPFDRIIKFTSMEFIPAAECGKPVIYLYPEKTSKIDVKVYPKGGFTFTEPEYNDGWEVMATPKGELTEISSNKKYPYLFWEGRGGLYSTPKRGFVTETKNMNKFLTNKLTELGLNQKEIADFLEFWEPKMQEKPYYFVTFLGNKEMDSLAPLDINPKPDTVIRVLMDYIPLDTPIEVEGYKIKPPERKGFTVVEWGGVLK